MSPDRRAALRKVLAAALLAPLLLAASACSKPAKLPRLEADAVVLAFGDSLTFGTGANEAESYPARLAALIGRRVVREGIPGETSAAGLARLPAVLDEVRPRLLLLCEGGNDFLRRLPRQQTADNLRAMIRLAKDRGVEVLLIGTPEPGFTLTPPGFYAELAKEFGIPYEGEALAKILKDGSLKSDQIHPNALGYRMMAERVFEVLRKAGAV
ncbi:MAG TPA: arylesterase [Burkholderiales bacterium]|nr:arylesterase [Burkholderiales bacterium]